MGKLHLKRTPAEQAEHELRKARKAARKAAKRARYSSRYSDEEESTASSSKRHKAYQEDKLDMPYGPQAYKPDYNYIAAQLEEERFREKMWEAFEDDERLDSAEARFNSYAHIPRRWRGGGMDRMDDELGIDPQMMEAEDYAEWVRVGMWRKKHAAEFEEQERKKAEHAAREARAKAVRDETKRMEREEEERMRQRRKERDRKRWAEARAAYEDKWIELSKTGRLGDRELVFADVPWPVLVLDVGPAPGEKGKQRALDIQITVEDLTVEAISTFLLDTHPTSYTADTEAIQKERRDKLRAAMLRFHPDKFEGKVMQSVREGDKERVREAAGKVTRAITDLLADNSRQI